MRAAAARDIAGRWLNEQWLAGVDPSGSTAGFCGAYVMGSLATLADDEEFFESASDIDIAILVEPELLAFDHRRHVHGLFRLYEGCVIQFVFVERSALDDEEKLLSMLGLGCNLRSGHILSDPHGVLGRAGQVVAEHWSGQRWVVVRTDRAIEFASRGLTRLDTSEGPVQQLAALCDLVMQLGGLVSIASGETPTHRRALVKAGRLLAGQGRSDLLERMLEATGAEHADESVVEEAIQDGLAALAIEARHPDRDSGQSAEFTAALPALAASGIRQIVDEGFVREAVLPALTTVATSASSVHAVAAPADRAEAEELAWRGLQRAGLTPSSATARLEALARLTGDVSDHCRAVALNHHM